MPEHVKEIMRNVPRRRMWITTITVAGILLIACVIVLFFIYKVTPAASPHPAP